MENARNFQGPRSADVEFSDYLNLINRDMRSFAACVRAHHPAIEEAIRNGIPLQAIVHGLSQIYKIRGSLAALKSALNRNRRMQEAEVDRQWYEQVIREQHNTQTVRAGGYSNAYPSSGKVPSPNSQGSFSQNPSVAHVSERTMATQNHAYGVPRTPLPAYPSQWRQQQRQEDESFQSLLAELDKPFDNTAF